MVFADFPTHSIQHPAIDQGVHRDVDGRLGFVTDPHLHHKCSCHSQRRIRCDRPRARDRLTRHRRKLMSLDGGLKISSFNKYGFGVLLGMPCEAHALQGFAMWFLLSLAIPLDQ